MARARNIMPFQKHVARQTAAIGKRLLTLTPGYEVDKGAGHLVRNPAFEHHVDLAFPGPLERQSARYTPSLTPRAN